MKILKIILLIITPFLIILYLYGIVNFYVSIKYEIEVFYGKKAPYSLAEYYAHILLSGLFWMICYVTLIMIYLKGTQNKNTHLHQRNMLWKKKKRTIPPAGTNRTSLKDNS